MTILGFPNRVADFPSATRVFALTHSRRKVRALRTARIVGNDSYYHPDPLAARTDLRVDGGVLDPNQDQVAGFELPILAGAMIQERDGAEA